MLPDVKMELRKVYLEFSVFGAEFHEEVVENTNLPSHQIENFPFDDCNDACCPDYSLSTEVPDDLQSIVLKQVKPKLEEHSAATGLYFVFRRKPGQFVLTVEPPYDTSFIETSHDSHKGERVRKGLISRPLLEFLGQSLGKSLSAICLAHIKFIGSSLMSLTHLQHLKVVCMHEVQLESGFGTGINVIDEVDKFGAWAVSHLHSLGISRVFNLLTKSICSSQGLSHCSAKSPYNVCFSAHTAEIEPFGLMNYVAYPYYQLAARNCVSHAHLMIYNRTPRFKATNESGFARILADGRKSIRSLEIHCRLDSLPRTVLVSLHQLENLRSLTINGTTKLLMEGELFWIARSCPLLEVLRLGKSCRELPTDDYRSLSVCLKHLRELSLIKAQNLTRPVLTMICQQNANLRVIYLERCKKIGGLHFQTEGVVCIAACLPNLEQIEVIDCGRISEAGVNALIANCLFLATIHFAGPDVNISSNRVLDGCGPLYSAFTEVGGRRFVLEKHTRQDLQSTAFEDFKMTCHENYALLKREPRFSTERSKYSLAPCFNACHFCNTVMIEF